MKTVHCGTYVPKVSERVQAVLRTEADVLGFYKYLQFRNDKDPENTDLCSVEELKNFCGTIGCTNCFQRVYNTITHSFGESDVVPIEFLGSNPLDAIMRFVNEPPSGTTRLLEDLHDAVDMVAEGATPPVGPRFSIGSFVRNLKVLLDQTTDLRWDAKKHDTHVLESMTSEQNEYICMMADCVTEFMSTVFKFETTRPFQKNACVFVQALVDVFERLFTSLFGACHKVRERFHRSSIPSLTNVNMPCYMDAYKKEGSYKTALVALHILNLQRIEAFRVFYTEACDQVVAFEPVYERDCMRLWKYVDQDDYLLPMFDAPMKTVLVAQLELALGPLASRSAEYTKGPYPTVIQELGMLELRCTKIQQGHLEIWTRTKDRVLHQLVPDGFALTDAIRADIEAASTDAVRMCTKAVQEYTAKMSMSAPVIDRTFRTDPLDALRQRGFVRMENLRMLCDFSFGLRHLSALAAFLHDCHPVVRERVCGTDDHVRVCVKNVILDAHIQMLLERYTEYARDLTVQEILNAESTYSVAPKCVRNGTKKSKTAKQKKMESDSPHTVAVEPKVSDSITRNDEAPPSTVEAVDDESPWEEVRSKKKYPSDTLKVEENERQRGKSYAKKKTASSKSRATNSISHSPSSTTCTSHTARGGGGRPGAAAGKRDRNTARACSPNPNRTAVPEPERSPVCVTESAERVATVTDPGPDPEQEPVVVGNEPPPAAQAAAAPGAETDPQQPKRERRRGRSSSKKQHQQHEDPSHVLSQILFASSAAPIDPLVLASYAASQVSEPVRMLPSQTVAVPARLFGGALPREYASVPFTTFPRVYI